MTEVKAPNYTEAQVAELTQAYAEGREAGKANAVLVPELAVSFGKTDRSIRSKLVSLKAYVKDEKPVKAPVDKGPGKKEILRDIENTGFDVTGFQGATKEALSRLLALVG